MAICMTDDTGVALAKQVKEQLGLNTRPLRMEGRQLFQMLAKMEGLNGLVFNPVGTEKPRAMAMGLVPLVLGAD